MDAFIWSPTCPCQCRFTASRWTPNFSAMTFSDTPLARISSMRVRSACLQTWQRDERVGVFDFVLMVGIDGAEGDAAVWA